MKKIICYLLITLSITSCTADKNQSDSEVELGENKEIDMTALCNCDSLSTDTTGILFLNSNVFSGKCYSNYPNSTQKYIEKEILKGEYHGKITYYNKQGGLLYSETYNSGKSMGDIDNQPHCNCMDLESKTQNGLKKHYLNHSIYTGKCSDNFPNSNQVYLEANYKDGLLHGYTIYYQKNGKVLIIHNYENGKIIKEITPQR